MSKRAYNLVFSLVVAWALVGCQTFVPARVAPTLTQTTVSTEMPVALAPTRTDMPRTPRPSATSTPCPAATTVPATSTAVPATPGPTVSPTPRPTRTNRLATPTVIPSHTRTLTPMPTPSLEPPPVLFAPPDGLRASLLDFLWVWERELAENESFEVTVWPDAPDALPALRIYTGETQIRITAAHLAEGTYRWQIIVVRGRDEMAAERGIDVSAPSDVRTFTVTRPSTVATIVATPPTSNLP